MPYELGVDGHLDEHRSSRFDNATITHEDDGTTTLGGDVIDPPTTLAPFDGAVHRSEAR
jgi:hypothetical protein